MTNAQILKDRIKKQCERQEKSMTLMLSELSLGVNAINQINEKKGMGAFTLSKIADYLNCSVDYLLGRTDILNGCSDNTNSFNQGNNSMQTVGNYNVSINKNSDVSEDAIVIDAILKSLPHRERIKFLNRVYDLEEEFKKKES